MVLNKKNKQASIKHLLLYPTNANSSNPSFDAIMDLLGEDATDLLKWAEKFPR